MIYLRILEEIPFTYNNIQYVARTYIPLNKPNYIYGEIVFLKNKQRPEKMRNIVRGKLKEYNEDVPLDSKRLVTHSAVKKLIDLLKTNA
jgi:hypothetical protein